VRGNKVKCSAPKIRIAGFGSAGKETFRLLGYLRKITVKVLRPLVWRMPAVAYGFPRKELLRKVGLNVEMRWALIRYELGVQLRAHNLLCEDEGERRDVCVSV
jgi:hypothetical protein